MLFADEVCVRIGSVHATVASQLFSTLDITVFTNSLQFTDKSLVTVLNLSKLKK